LSASAVPYLNNVFEQDHRAIKRRVNADYVREIQLNHFRRGLFRQYSYANDNAIKTLSPF
jgi:transposase-like protein